MTEKEKKEKREEWRKRGGRWKERKTREYRRQLIQFNINRDARSYVNISMLNSALY